MVSNTPDWSNYIICYMFDGLTRIMPSFGIKERSIILVLLLSALYLTLGYLLILGGQHWPEHLLGTLKLYWTQSGWVTSGSRKPILINVLK